MTVNTDCATDCDIYKEWLLWLFLNIWNIKHKEPLGEKLVWDC